MLGWVWGLGLGGFRAESLGVFGFWVLDPLTTVGGRNPFRTTLKPWETIVCWYFVGNHHSRVSWVVQDFAHPQYQLKNGVLPQQYGENSCLLHG